MTGEGPDVTREVPGVPREGPDVPRVLPGVPPVLPDPRDAGSGGWWLVVGVGVDSVP